MLSFFTSKKRGRISFKHVSACQILVAAILLLPFQTMNTYALQGSATSSEYKLRAAVIVGILRFTAWPKGNQSSKLDICLAGKPLASKHLMTLNNNHQIKGQEVYVHKVSKFKDLKNCKVLVLGEGIHKKTALEMIEYANKSPMISLCDGCKKNTAPKVTIRLILHKQRIHFEVDWLKAKENGILFDASLLELASKQRHQSS